MVQAYPKHQMHKLFGMFQQIDQSDQRKQGGTGLGLAITKAIVEQHGGVIGVDSTVEVGSKFWFELPAVNVEQSSEAALKGATKHAASPIFVDDRVVQSTSPVKILLVEDDQATREVLRQQLSALNVTYLEADDGAEALHLARQEKPDLIILDLVIPPPDGFDVVETLRKEHNGVKRLVVYTASDITDIQKEQLKLGLTTYLTKSRTSPEEFLTAVRNILNGLTNLQISDQEGKKAHADI